MRKSNFIELGICGATADARDIAYWMSYANNHLQTYRNPPQQEMANSIRFSKAETQTPREGEMTGCLELESLDGWTSRYCDVQASVVKEYFRERGLTQVRPQVSATAAWKIIISRDVSVDYLPDTGQRMHQFFLKMSARGIALHPTKPIREGPTRQESPHFVLGICGPFGLVPCTVSITRYPRPVSLLQFGSGLER